MADSNEPRHLHDIVYAVDVLRARGVTNDKIHVCTDHMLATQHLGAYAITNVHGLAGLDGVLSQAACDVAVVVVAGHGNPAGIGSPVVLSPAALLAKVRGIAGLKAGVILLTQCFAGVFNYLDALKEPPLVMVGATALNNSVSGPITLAAPIAQANGAPGLQSWSANLFSWNFFRWLSVRQDIDGDGQLTLMDAYKYAGVYSNKQLIQIKSIGFVAAHNLTQRLIPLVQQVEQDKKTPPTDQQGQLDAAKRKMELDATEKLLQGQLELTYLNQEP